MSQHRATRMPAPTRKYSLQYVFAFATRLRRFESNVLHLVGSSHPTAPRKREPHRRRRTFYLLLANICRSCRNFYRFHRFELDRSTNSNPSRSYAFVEFRSHRDAEDAHTDMYVTVFIRCDTLFNSMLGTVGTLRDHI